MVLWRVEFGMQVPNQSESHCVTMFNNTAEPPPPPASSQASAATEDKSQGEFCPLVATRLSLHVCICLYLYDVCVFSFDWLFLR